MSILLKYDIFGLDHFVGVPTVEVVKLSVGFNIEVGRPAHKIGSWSAGSARRSVGEEISSLREGLTRALLFLQAHPAMSW